MGKVMIQKATEIKIDCVETNQKGQSIVVLDLTVEMDDHGNTESRLYSIDAYAMVGWLTSALKQLHPSPQDQVIDLLEEIRDKI